MESPIDFLTLKKLGESGVPSERIHDRDLSGLDLSHADLSGVDLRGFVLSRLNLEGANLMGGDLRCASFAATNCVSASFVGADLRAANLGFGFFSNADFRGSDLRGARLTDAKCADCTFAGADLRGAVLGREMVRADFRGSDLRGAILPEDFDFRALGCDIRGALQTPMPVQTSQGNRRRLPRTKLIEPIRIFERKMMQMVGMVVDINEEGMGLVSTRPIPPQLAFPFRIELPAHWNIGEAIDIEASSVWCRFNEGTGKYHCGFRFTNMTQAQIGIIHEIMARSVRKIVFS